VDIVPWVPHTAAGRVARTVPVGRGHEAMISCPTDIIRYIRSTKSTERLYFNLSSGLKH
jgi:hypothetical protein